MSFIDNIKLGFELEFCGLDFDENAGFLFNRFGEFGQVKDDGSLNCGFEIASPIHCGANFIENNPEFLGERWNQLFWALRNSGAYEHSTAGMHVHVEHKDLTDEEIKKINLFLVHNPEFVQRMGERSFTEYCLPEMNSDEEIAVRESDCGDIALALSSRFPTLEFRFFCSVMRREKFLKNVQFVLALIESVRFHQRMSINEYSYKDYDGVSPQYGAVEVLKDFSKSFGNKDKYKTLCAASLMQSR